jgi:Tfp pilus assembly protein PilF
VVKSNMPLCALAVLLIGGCAVSSDNRAPQTSSDVTAFQAELARAYGDLAADSGSRADRELFEQKAFYARHGTAVPPEAPPTSAD